MIEVMLREEKRQFTNPKIESFVEIPPYNESASNSHKFTGQERDAHTNFDYMHFRFYGSSMGRFMKPDDVYGIPALPQSWNLYSYVQNNPINFLDPDGHLLRDAQGNLIIKYGAVIPITHRGDPAHTYYVRRVTLRTDSGKKIEASSVVKIKDKDKAGQIKDNASGKIVADLPDSSNPVATNCHGTTFADGKVWIQPNQVDKILKGDNYQKVENGKAQIGDVLVYRDKNSGEAVHSVTVTGVDDKGNVTQVTGLAGLETEKKAKLPGPGPGTAWAGEANVEVWHKEKK